MSIADDAQRSGNTACFCHQRERSWTGESPALGRTRNTHGPSTRDGNRDYAMDARNFFIPSPLPQSILKQNQFGGTIGGPIVKNRTFFFASYEGIRSIAQAPGTAVVLTQAERNGI